MNASMSVLSTATRAGDGGVRGDLTKLVHVLRLELKRGSPAERTEVVAAEVPCQWQAPLRHPKGFLPDNWCLCPEDRTYIIPYVCPSCRVGRSSLYICRIVSGLQKHTPWGMKKVLLEMETQRSSYEQKAKESLQKVLEEKMSTERQLQSVQVGTLCSSGGRDPGDSPQSKGASYTLQRPCSSSSSCILNYNINKYRIQCVRSL